MKLEYEWGKKDLKKELQSSRNKTNIIFLIIGIFLYVFVTFYAIKYDAFDTKIVLMYGVIYTFVLCLILVISSKIYVALSLRKNDKKTNKAYGTYKVELTDEYIMVSINDEIIKYKYNEINKYKKKKNTLFINTKQDKLGLLFKKKVIGKDKYQEMINYIESRLK